MTEISVDNNKIRGNNLMNLKQTIIKIINIKNISIIDDNVKVVIIFLILYKSLILVVISPIGLL